MKIQEKEKRKKYLELARELKKAMEHEVVIGVLEMIFKQLIGELEELEIGGQIETIQATTLLRSIRILRRILET